MPGARPSVRYMHLGLYSSILQICRKESRLVSSYWEKPLRLIRYLMVTSSASSSTGTIKHSYGRAGYPWMVSVLYAQGWAYPFSLMLLNLLWLCLGLVSLALLFRDRFEPSTHISILLCVLVLLNWV